MRILTFDFTDNRTGVRIRVDRYSSREPTLIAKKPAAEEETSLVNIEGIKATLLMEWALKDRVGIGRCVCRRMTRRIDWVEERKGGTRERRMRLL